MQLPEIPLNPPLRKGETPCLHRTHVILFDFSAKTVYVITNFPPCKSSVTVPVFFPVIIPESRTFPAVTKFILPTGIICAFLYRQTNIKQRLLLSETCVQAGLREREKESGPESAEGISAPSVL